MTGFLEHYARELMENPEFQARILLDYGRYVVLAMMVLGYLIMAYLLFVR